MSKNNEAIRLAYAKGYRVDKVGNVISFTGHTRKVNKNNNRKRGYYRFSVKHKGVAMSVYVHKLQAFQKFGEEALKPGVHTRHLDGDSTNNSDLNITIGDQSSNMLDRPKEDLVCHAIKASTHLRVASDDTVKKIRALREEDPKEWTYLRLMDKFNIKAKSTLWEILHRDYVTSK